MKDTKKSLIALKSQIKKRKAGATDEDSSSSDVPERALSSKPLTVQEETEQPKRERVAPLASDVWEALSLMMLRSIELCQQETARELASVPDSLYHIFILDFLSCSSQKDNIYLTLCLTCEAGYSTPFWKRLLKNSVVIPVNLWDILRYF